MEQNKTTTHAHAIERIYEEAGNFVVIGLTGRTGSGCSTAADILSSVSLDLPDVSQSHYDGNEKRKFRIVKSYIERNWTQFHWLRVRSIITRYILTLDFNSLVIDLSMILEEEDSVIKKSLNPFKTEYDFAHDRIKEYLALPEETKEEINIKKKPLMKFTSSGFLISQTSLGKDCKTYLRMRILNSTRRLEITFAHQGLQARKNSSLKEFLSLQLQ